MPPRKRAIKRKADQSLSPKKDSKVVKKESCRNCKKEFVQILKHLSQKPDCQAKYPDFEKLRDIAKVSTLGNRNEK